MVDEFDVGVVSILKWPNYGTALTYYALYKVLCDMGKKVLMISQPESADMKPTEAIIFREFPYPQNKIITLPDKPAMRTELNEICDVFLVGSDQLYNQLYPKFDKFASLDWVRNDKKRAAYAASFAFSALELDNKTCAEMGYFLSKFDNFSVREDSGINIAKKDLSMRINIERVLDPIFLCDKRHYNELAIKGNTVPEGITAYILDDSNDKEKIMADIQTRLSLPIIKLPDMNKNVDVPHPLVEDWVSSIISSKFVVTDSFHGVCFAIMYRKPFVAICNSGRGTERFFTILSALCLMDHLVYSFADYEKIAESIMYIDYNLVYEKLNVLKEKSITELQKAVAPLEYKRNLDTYDFMSDMLADMQYKLLEIRKKDENMQNELANIQRKFDIPKGITFKKIIKGLLPYGIVRFIQKYITRRG